MIKSLLVAHLLSLVTSQSPPLQVGETNQFILVKVNHSFNLSCPFTEVDFYKWNNLKSPTLFLSEQRELKLTLTSYRKTEIYECDAVNGYGKKTALFIVKGIDTNSKQFEIDCQLRETGPCFLVPGIANEFEYTIEDNKKVAMDCRAVMNSSIKDTLSYSWKRISSSDPFELKFRNSINNDAIKNTEQLLEDAPHKGTLDPNTIDGISKWGPIAMLYNVTKDMEGLYQCTASSSTHSIKRTFRLKVRVLKSPSTIEGPLFQHIQAAVGSTQTLYCKAYSKPKWGKKLDSRDETTENEETITWGGSRYRMLQGSLDIEHKANNGAVKDSKYYLNNLKLENLQISNSGIYVCTVLTSSTLEHKYVNLTVEAGSGYNDFKKNNNFPIYIAVPTTVFIICLATIIYCLIHRRIRQKANFKNRVVRGTTITTTNSSSGNGSYSGSKNTSNPRHHMLTTTTSSSKGSQNQFSPNSCYSGNITSVTGYGSNHPTFSSGYAPSNVTYNYNAAAPYIQATNNTPCSTDIDHPCSHHNCNPHNGHPVPYDSDSTPSPPPPTTIADTVSSSVINMGNSNGLASYSITGVSINSYSPNQSSQPYMPSQTPQGSSSTSASSPNAMYAINQQQLQPVYPVGVVYSA